MPTVPIVFTYERDTTGFGLIPSPLYNWIFSATYKDSNGTLHTVSRQRYSDDSLLPFSFDVDFDTLFPPSGTGHTTLFAGGAPSDPSEAKFTANVTYPDSLHEVTLRLDIHTGGHYGYMCRYRHPLLTAFLVQPERASEELPSVEPMPLQLTTEYPTANSGRPEHLKIYNTSLATLSVTGSLIADYGDGATDATEFSYTLPAATLAYIPFGGVPYYSSYLYRTPYLRVVTDNTLTEPSAATVIEDTATSYIAEIRIPRFTHYYETLGNSNPTLRATTNRGNCYPQANDPIPVANFHAVAGDDLNDLDVLRLDGSKSFDLTDDVDLWLWWWTSYQAGVEPPSEAPLGDPFQITAKDTPIVEFADVDDGEYWVYLYAGNDGILQPTQPTPYRYRQLSRVRRKRVTVGGGISVAYDENRLSWWLLRGNEGTLSVTRHLKHEAPAASGVTVGSGSPGVLLLVGADLFAVSRDGVLYQSFDEGQSWSEIMAIADVNLIAAEADDDGSAQYWLVRGENDALQRIVIKRSSGGWVEGAPETVIGLPESTRRPGSAKKSGAGILLSAKTDDGYISALSMDDMLTWTVLT